MEQSKNPVTLNKSVRSLAFELRMAGWTFESAFYPIQRFTKAANRLLDRLEDEKAIEEMESNGSI